MTLEEIRTGLQTLTQMRHRSRNRLMTPFLLGLRPEESQPPTYNQLFQAEQELRARLEDAGWHLTYSEEYRAYSIVPIE